MPRHKGVKLTQEQELEIIQLYQAGTKSAEILGAYGLSHDSRIYNVLHKHGVALTRGKNGQAHRGPVIRKLPPEEAPDEFRELTAPEKQQVEVQLARVEPPRTVKMVSVQPNEDEDIDLGTGAKKRYRVTIKVRMEIDASTLTDAAKKAMGYNGATEVLAAVRIG